MTEEWRRISAFPHYEVSSLGRVRRALDAPGRFQGKILRQYVRPSGYCCVGLRRDGGTFTTYVHRHVAVAFIGDPPSSAHDVAHRDGDASNNKEGNLRWATAKENEADKAEHGTKLVGTSLSWAKLNDDAVREIRHRYRSGETQTSLAAQYGVAQTKISNVVNLKTWRHVQ